MSKLTTKIKKIKRGFNLLNKLADTDSPKIVEMEGLARFLENTKSKLIEPKLDKTTNANTLYANDGSSQPTSITYTNQVVGNTACIRDANGRTKVMQAAEAQDAVNYAQMNLELDKKSPKLVAGDNIILTENPDGTITISASGGGDWEGLKFTAEEDDAPISYTVVGTIPNIGLQYSWNGCFWYTWDPDEVITLKKNEYIVVRNTVSTLSLNADNYIKFVINEKKIAASGRLLDLFSTRTTTGTYSCYRLFADCTKLTHAPTIDNDRIPGLGAGCFMEMFENCTSLTEAPELPHTILSQSTYNGMFLGCTNLQKAPSVLPAEDFIKPYEYERMFENCTSLVKAPVILHETANKGSMRRMFSGCTALEEVPKLNVTTLNDSCFLRMFDGCSSLKIKETSEEPTENLILKCEETEVIGAYTYMFSGTSGSFVGTPQAGKYYSWYKEKDDEWKGLRFTAEEDDAPISYTVVGTISNIGLQYSKNGDVWNTWNPDEVITLKQNEHIDVRNTIDTLSLSDNNFIKFVITEKKIAASGRLLDLFPSTATSVPAYGCFCLFNNCTKLTHAPTIDNDRISELGAGCFMEMFGDCISLTEAPELPHTTVQSSAYQEMFSGCANLQKAPSVLPAVTINQAFEYSRMFEGCTSLIKPPVILCETVGFTSMGEMFEECTSLKEAPRLNVTTFNTSSFHNMFFGCSSLKIKETDVEPTDNLVIKCEYSYSYSNAYTGMFNYTGGSFVGTPQADKYYSWYE